MCVPFLGWTLNGCPICLHSLVDVKDPMVFFAKNMQAIASTRNKFQITALTDGWEGNGKLPITIRAIDKLLRQHQPSVKIMAQTVAMPS